MAQVTSVRAGADGSDPAKILSPKVGAAALGSALSVVAGVILTHLLHSYTKQEIASLTGAIATVLSFAFGYLITDKRRR